MTTQSSDTIDLADVVRTLARGWRWILGGLLVGVILALAANWILPPRYDAVATVVLRDRTESSGSALSLGSGGLTEGLANLFSLPGQLGSLVDTEVEILASRTLLERTARSNGLQAEVRSPRKVGMDSLFSRVQIDPRVRKAVYRFERDGEEYSVRGPEVVTRVRPGEEIRLPGAILALRSDGLPESFKIRVLDLQDTVDRILRKGYSGAELLGGDLGEVTFSARDPVTAANAANTLIGFYLEERRGRMQELNRDRLAVLTHLADSLQTELSLATSEFREYQEAQRTFDPERLGDVERAGILRAQVDGLAVEAQSLDEILSRMSGDSIDAADLLAFPSFLQSEAINNLLDRIFALQGQRIELLERRTERDPEVILLGENIQYLEDELLALARSYRSGLQRQLDQLRGELEEYRRELTSRPLQEERTFELENEVERLTASYLGVQAQLVQARLGSIGEGMDLRQIDIPLPPKKPAFPLPYLNLAIGILCGLLLGGAGALGAQGLSGTVGEAREVEAVTGLPSVDSDGRRPILLGGVEERKTLLLIPLGGAEETERIARHLADTAALRIDNVAQTTLGELGMSEGGSPHEVCNALELLEERSDLVVVSLQGPEDPFSLALLHPQRSVILVAQRGRTQRREVDDTARGLRRSGIPVAGIVVVGG